MNARSALASLSIALLLAACGARDAQDADASATGASAQDEALPQPDPDGGAVTGMPAKPGPGPIGPPPAPVEGALAPAPETMPDAALAEGGELAPPSPDAAQQADQAAAGGVAPAAPEPGPGDAVAIVRGYYAALGGGDYARARALWSGGDAAGGHNVQELAAQYAGTATLTVEVGAPGRVDAAAGSRYVRVPVMLVRTLDDGSSQRSTGVVTLRRSVVDGATPDQRAWRIASADLRTQPMP